jgi:phosphate transport system substrate-binding protein
MRIPLIAAVIVLAAAGCGGSSNNTAGTTSTSASGGSSSTVLVGAGSTFVYPLVSQWIGDYAKSASVTVTYGAVGSGAGIAAITDRSVDFGASDAPLSPDQATACKDCLEIPWALGGTSVAYNLKGAPQHLKLTGPVVADIFLGKITHWNDPAIAKLNPGTSLPDTRVTPVFRSDASGTSYNFTDYLSHVSPEFKSKVSTTTQPTFPTGQGAKGSSGVSGVVSSTDGAITYVDVAYASSAHFAYAAMQNAAQKFTLPDIASCRAAAADAKSPKPNQAISIVNPSASAGAAYPICTFTYVIVPKRSPKAEMLKAFLTYAVTTGQAAGPKLLFAPLPPGVVAANKQAIAQITS